MAFFQKKQKNCEAVSYIYQQARKSKRSKEYRRQIRLNADKLQEYEKSRGMTLYSDSLTYEVCEDLHSFLSSGKLLQNTVSSLMSKIFTSFNAMKRDGYIVNEGYKDFRLKMEPILTVYLTSEEIKKLYQLKLGYRNAVIRDLFVIGCYTGMRYSDYSDLSLSNVRGNVITRKTQKTGSVVEIPIHPVVREIVDKYKGFPPYTDTQQNFNAQIKRICKRAGITDKVYIERTRGGKIERMSVPRYKMVSSHTARRSFATNAYIAGIPAARIMLLTGHSTEDAFFRYIRIGRSENAKTLAEHPFFQ